MECIQTFKHSPLKASRIIGKDVVSSMRETLGSIKEIMVDPATGKIAYVVLAFGGFLGLGEKLFALPFATLIYDNEEDEFILKTSKERLKNAPGFDPLEWPAMEQEQWNRDIHTYYELPPFWEI